MIPEPDKVVMSQTNEEESISGGNPVPDEMAAKLSESIKSEEAIPIVYVQIPIVDVQIMPEPEKVVMNKSQPNEDAPISKIVTPSRTYTSKLDNHMSLNDQRLLSTRNQQKVMPRPPARARTKALDSLDQKRGSLLDSLKWHTQKTIQN